MFLLKTLFAPSIPMAELLSSASAALWQKHFATIKYQAVAGVMCQISQCRMSSLSNPVPPKVHARPLVLCGPSGSGKSTLLDKLTAEFPDVFGFSVSHTTRRPRPGEKDGVHYHFVTKSAMMEEIKRGNFIEAAEFSGNLYGTSKSAVEDVFNVGKICILDIDMQGVLQIKKLPDWKPFYVFIKPPSVKHLEDRLIKRKTETEDSLKRRLIAAAKDLEICDEKGKFDLIIVNDDVEKAYRQLREFMLPEIQLHQGLKIASKTKAS